MKTYKVLETHIGEDQNNPYVPGDAKYGTRTMAATDAKTLLELGLLAEIEDDAVVAAPIEPPVPVSAASPEPVAAPEPASEPEQAPVAPAAPVTARKPANKAH